jgi:uncharacterized membrane protein YciS (DUF1049 family)
MEPLFVGIAIGFVLGAMVVGFFWSEYKKSENE